MRDFLLTLQKDIRLRLARKSGGTAREDIALAQFLSRTLDEQRGEIRGILEPLDESHPEQLLILAKVYLEEDRPEDARMALETLLSQYRDKEGDAELWALLAKACVLTDCPSRALQACHRLLDLSPEDMRPFNIMLVPLVRLGRYAELVELYGRARRLGFTWPYGSPADFVAQQDEAVSRGVPPLLFNALPKSASTHIGRSLQRGLKAPSCSIGLSLFPKEYLVPNWLALFSRGGAVCAQHIDARPENLCTLERYGLTRIVIHVRDPRQAILSWTHYLDGRLGSADVHTLKTLRQPPLPADYSYMSFNDRLDWQIRHYLPNFISWIERWSDTYRNLNSRFCLKIVMFEQFVTDPQTYFREICEFYGIQLSPELMPNAEHEKGTNFRSGEIDEWRQVFSTEQQNLAESMLSPSLRTAFGWQ